MIYNLLAIEAPIFWNNGHDLFLVFHFSLRSGLYHTISSFYRSFHHAWRPFRLTLAAFFLFLCIILSKPWIFNFVRFVLVSFFIVIFICFNLSVLQHLGPFFSTQHRPLAFLTLTLAFLLIIFVFLRLIFFFFIPAD